MKFSRSHYAAVFASVATLGLLGHAGLSSTQQPDSARSAAIAQASPQPAEGSPGHRHHHIDFAAAAATLGTSEAELKGALGLPEAPPERPRPDLAAAANQLGVSEADLQAALGVSPDSDGQTMRGGRPDLATAAAELEVTETDLRTALGIPANSPDRQRLQLDIASAASQLGVSEVQLIDALGIPTPQGDRPE
ncbi:MAG: hypothetical protein F6J95_026355 [Leptolyngbya sp. SIO1E4]|nr:hypothetical protein [Leptolyngbya sp. SIO1E4]